MQPWMKSRQWLVAIGLLALVVVAVVVSILTSDWGAPPPPKASAGSGQTQLVDEQPLHTARAMAKLASGADEQAVADQVAETADHEVDLAFHDALREAANHPPQKKPQNRPLYEHASQAGAQVKADQDATDRLKKEVTTASGARQGSLQEQLDVAQAQLELDQDELSNAQEDLVRAGADPGTLIQRQFDAHQAAEHGSDEKTATETGNRSQITQSRDSMLAQFAAWRALRGKAFQLQQARDESVRKTAALGQAHADLAKQISDEKASRSAGKPPPPNLSSPAPSGGTEPPKDAAKDTISSLHAISADQQNLADLDKRIQDERDLQNSYSNWLALVYAQQRAALHGLNQSLLWILLILLAVYFVDRAIDYYLAKAGTEGTRLHTLRAVIHFAVQALGVLLILLVILGAPQQMSTIVGLAGAGLTVALKDFIVAFFGWFVLMGKNGMRVGDWVEINGVAGEVIEINLLRTVLLETGNWTETGHPTGRKVAFVNSYAIEGHFFNFTTSGQWLWDELQMLVPANQDPYPLIDAIKNIVTKETEANARAAEEEWQSVASRYRPRTVSAAPAVDLRPTAAGVEVHVRYITRANERYAVRTRLSQALVQLLHHRLADEKVTVSAARS